MPWIDLSFPLRGEFLPADHGYLVYSAVSRLLPAAHQATYSSRSAVRDNISQAPCSDIARDEHVFGIHPIRGRQLGGRTLQLTEYSRLVIRTDADHIARFLPLAGKQLRILDRSLCIGVPQVHALVPAPALRSRLVTIKLAGVASSSPLPPGEGQGVRALSGEDRGEGFAAELFVASALRKLAELGINAKSPLPAGESQGEGGSVSTAASTPCSALLTLGKRRTLRIKDKEVVGYEVIVEGLTAAESISLQEHGLGGRRLMGCGIFVPVVAKRGGE